MELHEQVSSGTWIVDPEKQGAFVEAWAEFAQWSSRMPGAGTLRLGRDLNDSRRFVSHAAWENADAMSAWQRSPEFEEKLAHVLQHVDDFHRTMLDVVATGARGASTVKLPAVRSAG
jgi:heme-degrading monooxygenase HmoA